MTFVNFSNHITENWSSEQVEEAEKYGEIVYVPFPNVSPLCDEDEVSKLANEYVKRILETNPRAVMCQGEFTLCFKVVNLLKQKGIKVFAGCSERKVVEEANGKKTAQFVFERFREY